MDGARLRELVHSLQKEVAAQHQELVRLKPSLSEAETERVKLARRVSSLTEERDAYLKGMTEVSQRQNALREEADMLREALRKADAVHEQQRKDDTALF